MRQFRLLIFILTATIFGALPKYNFVYANDVVVKVPVCEEGSEDCRQDIALQTAIERSAKTSDILSKCNALKKIQEIVEPCEYSVDLEYERCNSVTSTNRDWANVADIKDGLKELEDLISKNKNGLVFGENLKVVEVSGVPPLEKHLAICSVRVIKNTVGAPHECVTVAIIADKYQLMRAKWVSGSSFPEFEYCPMSSSFTVGGKLAIEFNVTPQSNIDKIASSIYEMISNDLLLETEIKKITDKDGSTIHASLVSTSALRTSKIIAGGWRESIDLDVNVGVRNNAISIYAHTKPMVCREASGNIVEYHGPTTAQMGMYAAAFNSSIQTAISKACQSFKVVDSKNLICN